MKSLKVQLNNSDDLFHKWIKTAARKQVISVVFEKRDGTERTLACTTSPAIVPAVESETPKREKQPNSTVFAAYDVEAKAWRSFRWNSVKQIKCSV